MSTHNPQSRRLWSSVFAVTVALFLTVTAAGGVSGGVDLHPQYQGHETAKNPAQHAHQPLRYTQDRLSANVQWIQKV